MSKNEEKTLKSPCTFILTLEEQAKLDREAVKFTTLSHQGTRVDVIKNLIKKLK